MSDKIRDTRAAAFAACPRTGCDWSSFWRGRQAAIAQQSAPVAVPDGWQPVPVEPTPKMLGEGSCAISLPGPHYITESAAKQCWAYMLAAAPTAPAAQVAVGQEPVAWISVNERMPSEDAEVIVSGWAYNDAEQGRYVALAEFSDGSFKPSGAADEYDTLHPPTHWMPLPAAPGETAPPAAEQPDTVKVSRELLAEMRAFTLDFDSGRAGALRGFIDKEIAAWNAHTTGATPEA